MEGIMMRKVNYWVLKITKIEKNCASVSNSEFLVKLSQEKLGLKGQGLYAVLHSLLCSAVGRHTALSHSGLMVQNIKGLEKVLNDPEWCLYYTDTNPLVTNWHSETHVMVSWFNRLESVFQTAFLQRVDSASLWAFQPEEVYSASAEF
jgi:hypothetical protein